MPTSVAFLSYAVAAVAFFTLSILLVTIWRDRSHSDWMAIASFITVVWATIFSLYAYFNMALSLVANSLESLRSAGWIIFLLILLSPPKKWRLSLLFHAKPYVLGISGFLLLQFFATVYSQVVSDLTSTYFFGGFISLLSGATGRVAVSVIGMLLVEQFFRNMPDKGRWGIKFACLAIGGLFVYDFYLYSDAMLFQKINSDIWIARGIVDAFTVPLLAISVIRNPKWSQGMLVSRSLVLHSATLFGAALYLLAMAAAGYYLRFFGGSWGFVMQVAFLFGAIILLAVLLFSGSVRAWLKVFISKHFYNYNYDYRDEWIRFTRTLSMPGPDLAERAIRALAALVESPAAALYVRKDSEQCELSSQWNMRLDGSSQPMDSSFCRLLEEKQWVIDLHNVDLDSSMDDGVSIPVWLRAYERGWLVLPLILQGRLFGFVVLAQARSAIKLNWEVLDLLKIAGTQAASYLAQQDSANALMVARQFESFNRMSTFMVHDLKNLVAQLSLLVSNAEKHQHKPEFQKDMLDTVDHSVQKMKVLLQKLSRGVSIDDKSTIFLDELLHRAVASKSPYEPKPILEILEKNIRVSANRERLERVIGHVIQNAIEATPKNGEVRVRLSQQDHHAVVEIMDNGVGMTEDFILNRLFSPFVSTKVAGMGIGVFETKEYIEELGGSLEVSSSSVSPANGTTFTFFLSAHGTETKEILA
jgi:putative PEP-CTERM system histidine kinase